MRLFSYYAEHSAPHLSHQVTILWCKSCGRYLQPPKHWLKADLGGCGVWRGRLRL